MTWAWHALKNNWKLLRGITGARGSRSRKSRSNFLPRRDDPPRPELTLCEVPWHCNVLYRAPEADGTIIASTRSCYPRAKHFGARAMIRTQTLSTNGRSDLKLWMCGQILSGTRC